MLSSSYLFLSILSLIALSPLIWIVRPHRSRIFGWISAIPPALIAVWLLSQAGAVAEGHYVVESINWVPQLGMQLSFRLDGLGLLFGLIITVIGSMVALYTNGYLDGDKRQGYFYALLYLFMASMLGIVWTDNLLTLFVFWEGTSVTSYLLIAFNDEDPGAQAGGRRAFIVTAAGGLAMLLGMVILGLNASTFTISEIIAKQGGLEAPGTVAAIVLILLGAFTKSAQFPFQFWLPGAMAAPTPASAYLHSATMVKAGVYLLARMHPALSESPVWFWTLLVVGGITMLLGAISAIRYYDMKALLAYATVSLLGVLVFLLAFDSDIAYTAVVVGILAHALYKGPFFLVAGIVDHATGTRDLRRLSGLLRPIPLLGVTAILAGLSMAGIPPLLGFLAKETFLDSMFGFAEHNPGALGWLLIVAAAVTGAFFVGLAFTLIWEIFLRGEEKLDDPAHVHHPPSFSFQFAPAFLVAIGSLVFIALPWFNEYIFGPAASSIAGVAVHTHVALWHGFTPVLVTSLVAIVAGAAIFAVRGWLRQALAKTPSNLTGVYVFDRTIYGIYDLARVTTRYIQGGTLASQASVVLLTGVAVLVYVMLETDWMHDLPIDWSNQASLTEIILSALAVTAAFVTVRARTRLTAIISIGVVGITVTLFFVFFGAPDLALTQLLVDILTVVLLILVFYRIPPQSIPALSSSIKLRNAVVSVSVGGLGAFLVLYSIGRPFYQSIADYFMLNSVPLAHGANIVNVILVDFRGFDTMGEITVLAIAGVGGYALLRSTILRSRPAQPETSVRQTQSNVDDSGA
ncbi:MAG: hydrogen gas-evolving membrane-bound hydrogenase subunit E [Caldilineaceae bacterium]